MTQVPARIEWAVQLLQLTPQDRVLEFGCGPGVGASLVADRLTRVYGGPGDVRTDAVARAVVNLTRHGFYPATDRGPDASLVAVLGRAPSR